MTNAQRNAVMQTARTLGITYRDALLEYLYDLQTSGIGGGGVSLTKFGQAVTVSTTITRPANTTLYTNGDSINSTTTNSSSTTISTAFQSTYGGILQSLYITTNKASITPQLRVYIYSSTQSNIGASIFDDNTAFNPSFTQADDIETWIDMPPMANTGSFTTQSVTLLNNIGLTIAGNTSLNFHLQIISGAFTPDSGQQFFINAVIDQN